MTLVKLIPNGARVSTGDMLAEFDPTQQIDDAREAKAKYEDLGHQIAQKQAEQRSAAAQRMSQIREAEADFDKAKLQLRKGPLLSEIDRLKNEAKADGAQARVDSLKKSNAMREKAEAAAVRILELQRDRQKIALERAQTNLDKLIIKAQHGGMIAHVNSWRNGSMGPPQEGDQLWSGQGLLRIFDPSHMVVEATVNQADSVSLKTGSTAKVALDAYPGAVFDAVLEFASPVASSGLDSPIKFFPARFRLQQSDPRLLPDLSAAVDIQP